MRRRGLYLLRLLAIALCLLGCAGYASATNGGAGDLQSSPMLHAYDPAGVSWSQGTALNSELSLTSVDGDVWSSSSPVRSVAAFGSSTAAEEGDGLVNLASEERTTHILYGDATGGGHLYPGLPGKTSFPSDWSAAQVMHQISDVATDPESGVVGQQGARTVLEGTRGGVNIRVVTNGSDIITGYPTNLPRNP